MFLSYYGNDGKRLIFGLLDYLGVGISVGFCVVIPLIFFTYLCDGNILIFVSNNNTSTTIFNSRALVTTYFWMLFYRVLFSGVLVVAAGVGDVHGGLHHDLQLLLSPSVRSTCWQGAGVSVWRCLRAAGGQHCLVCSHHQKVNSSCGSESLELTMLSQNLDI